MQRGPGRLGKATFVLSVKMEVGDPSKLTGQVYSMVVFIKA